jgi:hypothetical protein
MIRLINDLCFFRSEDDRRTNEEAIGLLLKDQKQKASGISITMLSMALEIGGARKYNVQNAILKFCF